MMQSVKAKTETDTKHAITDNDCDPLFERKIQNATEGLNHDCFKGSWFSHGLLRREPSLLEIKNDT